MKIIQHRIIQSIGVIGLIGLVIYFIPFFTGIDDFPINKFILEREENDFLRAIKATDGSLGIMANIKTALYTFYDTDGLNESWIRTFTFATISSIFNITVALAIAIILRKLKIFSKEGKWLVFLLIPVLLGNVSIAFLGKILFSNNALFHETVQSKFITLLCIQFWQFGTLYIYLFWLVINNIPKTTLDFAISSKLKTGEQIRDIFLPALKNLSILLFILNFIFTWYEDAKIQFIFKSSRGTNSELITQWLNRDYQSISLLNPNTAIQNTFNISLVVVLIALISIIFLTLTYFFIYKKITTIRAFIPVPKFPRIEKVIFYLLLICISIPIIYPFCNIKIKNIEFAHLTTPLFYSFISAFIATFIAIILGITWRLGWQKILFSFNNKSLFFLLFLFILMLIPPIISFILGFKWLKIIGYVESNLYFIWVIGHIILVTPLLSSFITVTHFRTTNNEINYFRSYKLSFYEQIKDIFLQKFKADYLLTFLIALSLIWNEAIINSVLSDFIPSFVTEMKLSVTGKSTDYSKALAYFSISIGIAVVAISIWKSILNNLKIEDDDNNI